MIAAIVWVLWASAANYHGPTPPGQFADKATCEHAIHDANLGDAGLVCLAVEVRKPPADYARVFSWLLIVNYHPVDHPRELGVFTDKETCETIGRAYQQSLRWKVPQVNKDPRTYGRYDAHKVTEAISFECVKDKDYAAREEPN